MRSVTANKSFLSIVLAFLMLLSVVPTSLYNTTYVSAAETGSVSKASSVPEGFVYTKGTQFMMDRNTYYYGGTNCYYLTYKSKTAVNNVLNNARDMGLNVIRIWGHLDVGQMTDQKLEDGVTPVFEGNNDNNGGVATKDGVYFQYWDPQQKKPVINEGENGLRRLDYVISEAEKRGIKLIITFTNYWEAFGGMGQYIKYYQMLNGETPDNNKLDEKSVCEFYTNETIKQWYKDYINALVNHTNYYTGEKLKDSEAVFSWELSNEPRCAIDGDGNTFCKDNILYNWVTEMSAYVKSVDPYHMVSIGDEGFYCMGYHEANNQKLPSAAYSGYYGVDFEKLMTIDTVDFGTPHMYVDQWGFKEGDDLEWIKRHAQTAKNADKPVVLEEFGLTNKEERDSHYEDWLSIMTGDYYDGIEYQGFNYWMIASWIDEPQQSAFGDGRYYYSDYDQYTVYGPAEIEAKVGSPNARTLIVDAAAKMNAKNINNTAEINTDTVDRSYAVDVVADLYIMLGQFEGVACDGKALLNGTDYSVNGNIVTINKDYFKTLELGSHTFKLIFTEGNSPSFAVKVIDSSVIDAELSAYTLDVDKSPYAIKDVSIGMTLNNNEFRGIKNGKNTLAEGTDYTVSDHTVTIKANYLTSLAKGETVLTFDFYEGNDRDLVLNISDSSTRIWEGSFDIGNWTNSLTINKNLAEWESGNLLFVLENANDCQLQLNYVDKDNSIKKIIDYTNAFSADEYTLKLSPDQFEKLRTATAIVVKGKNAIIKSIDIEDGVRSSEYVPDDSSATDSSSETDSSSNIDSSSDTDSSSQTDSSSDIDSSSDADSSSETDSSSEADTSSDVDSSSSSDSSDTIIIAQKGNGSLSWGSDYTLPFSLGGYESAQIVFTGNAGSLKLAVSPGWTELTVVSNINGTYTYTFTPSEIDAFSGDHKLYVQGEDGSINSVMIIGTKTGEEDSSSQPVPDTDPEYVSTNLTLSGVIGANTYYTVPDGYINDNYKVEAVFTATGVDDVTVPLDTSKTKIIDGKNTYIFTLPVKSCDMSKKFRARLYVKTKAGDEVFATDPTTITLNQYISSLGSTGTDNEKAFANAMLTYGYYSQKVFAGTAPAGITPIDLSDVTYRNLRSYQSSTVAYTGTVKGSVYGTSLYLDSGTGIRSYVTNLNGVNTDDLYMQYTANGETKRVKAKYSAEKNAYYGEISDIGANKLSTMYQITFVEGSKQISDEVFYGAYSYIYSTLRGSTASEDEVNLAKALYKYAVASERLITAVD